MWTSPHMSPSRAIRFSTIPSAVIAPARIVTGVPGDGRAGAWTNKTDGPSIPPAMQGPGPPTAVAQAACQLIIPADINTSQVHPSTQKSVLPTDRNSTNESQNTEE